VTEGQAIALTIVGAILVAAVAMLGLHAIDANGAAVSLGAIVPAIVASYLMARIVMHYSD
jgi:fructose-specific phosphotransferase system IIC component